MQLKRKKRKECVQHINCYFNTGMCCTPLSNKEYSVPLRAALCTFDVQRSLQKDFQVMCAEVNIVTYQQGEAKIMIRLIYTQFQNWINKIILQSYTPHSIPYGH